MELTFIVKQSYERLTNKASHGQPRKYDSWTEDIEMHFFAEEVYDIIASKWIGSIPNPITLHDKFIQWVDAHRDEVAKIIYDSYEPDVIDYDKASEGPQLDNSQLDREYHELLLLAGMV